MARTENGFKGEFKFLSNMQLCKLVKRLPDTLEEAYKYYQEINPRN